MFRYCGLNSKVNILPKLRNVIIEVVVRKRVYPSYSIIGSFSIMEKRLVTNVQVPDAMRKPDSFHFGIKVEQILQFKSGTMVLYLWIYVHKDNHVILKHLSPESQKIQVYDGPGTMSNLLSSGRKVYKCSTFQCTVQVSWVFHKSILQLNHSAKELSTYKSFKNTNSYVTLPNSNCSSKVCILIIKFDHGYKVNVTLHKMTFQGLKSEYGKYGGLSFIEVFNKEYSENGVVCKNDFDSNPKRRFYSAKASLKVVLYWYEPYSSTSVTLTISNTRCDLLQLSTLIHCHECYRIQPLCKRFLNKIARHSSIPLHNQFRDILYTLPQGKCFVLQIFEKYDEYSESSRVTHSCFIWISSNLIHEEDSTIHFFITGSIHPYFIQPVDETILQKVKMIVYFYNRNRILDYMSLYGSIDLFCYPSHTLPSLLVCDKDTGGSFSKPFFNSFQQHQLQNISYLARLRRLKMYSFSR